MARHQKFSLEVEKNLNTMLLSFVSVGQKKLYNNLVEKYVVTAEAQLPLSSEFLL